MAVTNPEQFDSQPIYTGGDPDVEMVPTETLSSIQPGNPLQWGTKGGPSPAAMADDIRANGWESPAVVRYYHGSKTANVGEGNHRIAAASLGGISHVPVRVVRYSSEGPGTAVPGFDDSPRPDDKWAMPRHVPGEMRPSQIGLR
jgi:hypothetical protein